METQTLNIPTERIGTAPTPNTTQAERAFLKREATEAKQQMRECVRSIKGLLDLRLWIERHPTVTAGVAAATLAGAGWGVSRTVRGRGVRSRRRRGRGAVRQSVVLTARTIRKAVVGTLIARVVAGLSEALSQTASPQEARRNNGIDRQSPYE